MLATYLFTYIFFFFINPKTKTPNKKQNTKKSAMIHLTALIAMLKLKLLRVAVIVYYLQNCALLKCRSMVDIAQNATNPGNLMG